jgi:hypothetical protein
VNRRTVLRSLAALCLVGFGVRTQETRAQYRTVKAYTIVDGVRYWRHETHTPYWSEYFYEVPTPRGTEWFALSCPLDHKKLVRAWRRAPLY